MVAPNIITRRVTHTAILGHKRFNRKIKIPDFGYNGQQAASVSKATEGIKYKNTGLDSIPKATNTPKVILNNKRKYGWGVASVL